MTDQPQTITLRDEVLRTLRDAESRIEAKLEASEVKAALTVIHSDDTENGVAEAKNTVEAARQEAHAIADKASQKIRTLVEAPDADPAEVQQLVAVVQASLDDMRPGIRFSDHLDEMAGKSLDPVESAAMNFEATLQAVMNPFLKDLEAGLEDAGTSDTYHAGEEHVHALHSDTVDLFGTEVTVPGGLYTIVFVVLAVVTIVEVIMAESGLPNVIAYPLLSALSIGKAVLVVLYYMHLKEDSRIFAWSFGLPLAMAALIILFLLVMNPVTY